MEGAPIGEAASRGSAFWKPGAPAPPGAAGVQPSVPPSVPPATARVEGGVSALSSRTSSMRFMQKQASGAGSKGAAATAGSAGGRPQPAASSRGGTPSAGATAAHTTGGTPPPASTSTTSSSWSFRVVRPASSGVRSALIAPVLPAPTRVTPATVEAVAAAPPAPLPRFKFVADAESTATELLAKQAHVTARSVMMDGRRSFGGFNKNLENLATGSWAAASSAQLPAAAAPASTALFTMHPQPRAAPGMKRRREEGGARNAVAQALAGCGGGAPAPARRASADASAAEGESHAGDHDNHDGSDSGSDTDSGSGSGNEAGMPLAADGRSHTAHAHLTGRFRIGGGGGGGRGKRTNNRGHRRDGGSAKRGRRA